MIVIDLVEDLRSARAAYERREWVAAYRALSDAGESGLTGEDFMALATTAYLLGRRNDCVHALQRSFQVSMSAGEWPAAVRAAYWLTVVLGQAGELAVANGWRARAVRLLEGQADSDVAERGYLSDAQMMAAIMAGDFPSAVSLAPQITECGGRFGDPDLLALGMHAEGRLMIMSGRVSDGLARMDEALVGVVANEVTPITAGRVYCSTIEACQEVSDYGRAGQWTHALTSWCDSQPGLVAFTGQCSTHRGQLLRLHGAFADAIDEFEQAVVRYRAAGGDPAVGLANYERGETLRMCGDFPGAEVAFDEAAAHGHPAQPGRALLWLAQGRGEAASAAVRRLVAERQHPVERSQVLAAAVEILVAEGDVSDAIPLAEELAAMGEEFGCTGLEADGLRAIAIAELAREEWDRALAKGHLAADAWSRLDAPYEVARSRTVVGLALRGLGDEESATAELREARRILGDLGAHPALAELDALLPREPVPGGLSPRETEVLRLVATGKSNPEIAEELVISQKTVARHLSNIFTKLDVRTRTAAAAYAYEHGLV